MENAPEYSPGAPHSRPPCTISAEAVHHSGGGDAPSSAVKLHFWGGICKQTKQMVCGYALGHYLEHQLLMDLHTLDKFLTIKDKHILLYEHNAFTSHLMLDSDEVYQMTKRGLDAAQISVAKRIHLNLVMVKLLELHHLGYDLRHYHAQHHAFIKQFNLPAHFQFDVAAG